MQPARLPQAFRTSKEGSRKKEGQAGGEDEGQSKLLTAEAVLTATPEQPAPTAIVVLMEILGAWVTWKLAEYISVSCLFQVSGLNRSSLNTDTTMPTREY